MMPSYVESVPGQVGHPSFQFLVGYFFCHDGQNLSPGAPVGRIIITFSKTLH